LFANHGKIAMVMSGDNSWQEEDILVIGNRGEISGSRGDGDRFKSRRKGERTRKRRGGRPLERPFLHYTSLCCGVKVIGFRGSSRRA
jgi:hypothetical protein